MNSGAGSWVAGRGAGKAGKEAFTRILTSSVRALRLRWKRLEEIPTKFDLSWMAGSVSV